MLAGWKQLDLGVRDVVSTLVLTVLLAVAMGVEGSRPAGWLLLVAAMAPLCIRRSHPETTWVAVVAVSAAGVTVDEVGVGTFALLLGAYTVVVYGRRGWPLWSVWVPATAVSVAQVFAFASDSPATWLDVVAWALLAAFAVGLGASVRELHVTAEQLALRAAELDERNRELSVLRRRDAELAVLAERQRIARDVHDVVGHHLTATVIHAGAAARLLERQPDDARVALGHVAANGTEAIEAMRRLVGYLGVGHVGTEPQPTLRDLDELVHSFRMLGLAVVLQVDVGREPPADVQVAAFRVIQESLTNVVRHAGARQAWVSVAAAGDGGVRVTVDDDGSGGGDPSDPVRPGAHGVRNMVERASSCGGSVTLGRSSSGGWRVRATFSPRARSAAMSETLP